MAVLLLLLVVFSTETPLDRSSVASKKLGAAVSITHTGSGDGHKTFEMEFAAKPTAEELERYSRIAQVIAADEHFHGAERLGIQAIESTDDPFFRYVVVVRTERRPHPVDWEQVHEVSISQGALADLTLKFWFEEKPEERSRLWQERNGLLAERSEPIRAVLASLEVAGKPAIELGQDGRLVLATIR
ncbi:MAG: hypothetical protein KDD69_04725 [Bdellovibrionales bacterium]|nr:hypothetical protein [Bdellovibrionales bacterium]